MENKTLKLLVQIIFFGAIWGIFEATIGHYIHYFPALISGSIMFPIASLILYQAYQKTSSKSALLYIAFVAVAIKSVDFLLPLPYGNPFKVINPMIAIIMEALLVYAVIKILNSNKVAVRITALPIASILWRGGFVLYMLVQYALTGNLAPYLASANGMITFILIDGLVSGIMAVILVEGYRLFSSKLHVHFEIKPLYAGILTALAFVLTLTL
ncbi:MAG: hypothetical protein JXR62_06130 [Bacilli bacterium]|nr:hypothetical protein [Bacilli bacterium]